MRLTTARLILREFVEDDWKAVQAYQSDPLYTRYHAWEQPSEKDAREFVGRFVSQQQEQPRMMFDFVIALPEDGRLIGNCGLRVNDASLREGNIGYELDSRYWGNGYATEAAREMLRLGFEDHNLHRIWAGCVAENVGSARVLERIGMKREGHFREKYFFKSRWWDSLHYAILVHEWQAQRSASRDEP